MLEKIRIQAPKSESAFAENRETFLRMIGHGEGSETGWKSVGNEGVVDLILLKVQSYPPERVASVVPGQGELA